MIEETLLPNRFDTSEMAQKLECMKADISLPKFGIPDGIQALMDRLSSLNSLKSLSATELEEYSILLSMYSLSLLDYENRINAYEEWCEANIKYIVGRELPNAYGYGFVEKDIFIRANNTNAQDLDNRKLSASTKRAAIKFLSQKIQFLSDKLDKLAYQRRRESNLI